MTSNFSQSLFLTYNLNDTFGNVFAVLGNEVNVQSIFRQANLHSGFLWWKKMATRWNITLIACLNVFAWLTSEDHSSFNILIIKCGTDKTSNTFAINGNIYR